MTYDPSTRIVTWTINFSDLSGPATMAHFQGPAVAGRNGPVILCLTTKGSPAESPIRGNATLTPDQAKEFSARQWYINAGELSKAHGKIAEAILQHPTIFVEKPIEDLVIWLSVSAPTITRFSRAIGCDGLRDLKLKVMSSMRVGMRYLEPVTPPDTLAEGAGTRRSRTRETPS